MAIANPFPSVDMDLFVNAASRGVADGLKTPSMFSAFSQGLISGIDDQQKYEMNQQLMQSREIENQLKQEQVVAAERQNSAYRADPQAYVDTELEKQKAEFAKYQEQQKLIQLQDKFTTTLQTGTDDEKFQAMTGGEYAALFSADPKIRDQGVRAMAGTARAQEFYDLEYQETKQKLLTQRQINLETQDANEFRDATREADADGDIGVAVNDMRTLTNDPSLTRDDLALNGYFVTKTHRPQTQAFEQNPDGSYKKDAKGYGIPVLKNGQPVMRDMTDAEIAEDPTKNKITHSRVYMFGKPGQEKKEYSLQMPEASQKRLSKYGGFLQLQHGYAPGQPKADSQNANVQINQKREEEAAAVQAQIDEKNKQYKSNEEAHLAGVQSVQTPAPQSTETYEQRMRRIESTRKGVPTAQATQAPNSLAIPIDSPTTVSPVVTRQSGAPTPALPTPMAQSSSTPEPQSTKPQPPGTPSTVDVQRSRANELRQRFGMPASAMQPASFQVQQSNVSFIPTSFTLERSNRFKPADSVVATVWNEPALQGYSALAKAVAAVESGGNPNAKSPTGVVGLMQTTQAVMDEAIPGGNRRDPNQSAFAGAVKLESLQAKYQNPMLALVAYNAGPGVVNRAIKLAGTTDWQQVKAQIPRAVASYPEFGPGKAKEALEYADKVVAYFPSFVQTIGDLETANRLKTYKVLDWSDSAPEQDSTSSMPQYNPRQRFTVGTTA